MKLAISNIGWDKGSDNFMYELLQKNDIKGLEIAPTRIWDNPEVVSKKEALQFKNKLKKYGLSVVAFQSLLYGKTFSLFSNEGKLYLMRLIDLASYFGKIAIVIGSPKNRNCDDMKMAINFFKELNDYANNRVTLCIEPNPVEYGTNFINTTKEAISFAKKTGIKINLDCGTISLNNEDLKIQTDCIGHIHFSEPYLRPLTNFEMFKNLKFIDYDGWYSIESKTFTYGSLFI
jgi:sugar phosphate isomerase/epimerase